MSVHEVYSVCIPVIKAIKRDMFVNFQDQRQSFSRDEFNIHKYVDVQFRSKAAH